MLLLLDLRRELAEMHHLSRRCLIGVATTANRRGSASSGHHACAVSPRCRALKESSKRLSPARSRGY